MDDDLRGSARPTGPGAQDGRAAELLAQARSGVHPPSWYVWPMQRDKVRRGLIQWAIYGLGGFLVLVPALFIMIPDNFTGDEGKAIASLVILALVGLVAFGSVFYFIKDLRRLAHPDAYLLLMTPDDFLKAEPRRITHVPMDNVANVTLKGVRRPGSEYVTQQSMRATATGALLRRPPRAVTASPFRAPLLTFRDTRNNKVVTLTQDDAFDDIRALEEVLSTFVDEKVKARKAAEAARDEVGS
jgi:hypothetical protein